MHPAARLRRILPRLDALGEDGAWLGEALACYLDGETFEEALGLAPRCSPVEAREMRDAAVQRIAGEHFGRLSVRSQAANITTIARRLRHCPDLDRVAETGGAKGAVARLLLSTHADIPGDRRLREILGSRGLPSAHGFEDGRDDGGYLPCP
jgi:hypothetical protein